MKAIIELITRRRRQILVHSVIYYRLNTNIISDHTYDAWSEELVKLQRDYPQESEQAPFANAYREFDGSTGAFLPIHEPNIIAKAVQLIDYHKRKGGRII